MTVEGVVVVCAARTVRAPIPALCPRQVETPVEGQCSSDSPRGHTMVHQARPGCTSYSLGILAPSCHLPVAPLVSKHMVFYPAELGRLTPDWSVLPQSSRARGGGLA